MYVAVAMVRVLYSYHAEKIDHIVLRTRMCILMKIHCIVLRKIKSRVVLKIGNHSTKTVVLFNTARSLSSLFKVNKKFTLTKGVSNMTIKYCDCDPLVCNGNSMAFTRRFIELGYFPCSPFQPSTIIYRLITYTAVVFTLQYMNLCDLLFKQAKSSAKDLCSVFSAFLGYPVFNDLLNNVEGRQTL